MDEKLRRDGLIAARRRFRSWVTTDDCWVCFTADNLLNRRDALVDSIRRVGLSGADPDSDKAIGTVTIFQGDLRIATNVRSEDGSRAVGTRLSRAVYDEVLTARRHLGGAGLRGNDWYITAYEPIRDPQQR